MNHFFRSIVFFISFVAFWNCYAEIDPWLPRVDTVDRWLWRSYDSYTREIVLDKRSIFWDWIRIQKVDSEYTIINTTDIPLYLWIKWDVMTRSYWKLPDILPENFEPRVKLVSSKTYRVVFGVGGYEAVDWFEWDSNGVTISDLTSFGLIKTPERSVLPHQIPEDIPFSIPVYYNWQRWEITWYIDYSPTLQHYYNYYEYLRSKPETGFLFLIVIGIFSIFLVIKTMRHFSRN